MTDRTQQALAALRSIRHSPGYRGLPHGERQALAHSLGRLESTLGGRGGDPYAMVLETPLDLQRDIAARSNAGAANRGTGGGTGNAAPPAPAPRRPAAPPATATIGERAAQTLDAVDFPGFVAGLIHGTFQAIVDATTQQVREYADLVGNLSKTVDSFARDNVSDNQVRDWLATRYPGDLRVVLPEPGATGSPRLLPRPTAEGTSPGWLSEVGLEGRSLSDEFTDGELIDAARRFLGEERLQTLATMVLMGINRIVVDEGHIRAKLQFHASARDRSAAQLQTQQVGMAAQQTPMQTVAQTMVSTVVANTQATSEVRADLMGEVHIQFSSQVFPLERFADSAAIQLINRHAKWQAEGDGAPAEGSVVSTPETGT